MIIFIIVCLATAGSQAFIKYSLTYDIKKLGLAEELAAGTELTIVLSMSIIFSILLYQLKSNYTREYLMNFRSMLFFFFVENSITLYVIIYNHFGLLKTGLF